MEERVYRVRGKCRSGSANSEMSSEGFGGSGHSFFRANSWPILNRNLAVENLFTGLHVMRGKGSDSLTDFLSTFAYQDG